MDPAEQRIFALTGVAGYIAPRHLRAISDTGHRLVAAVDPHDSVGILDSYFHDVAYFREFERFDRHLERMRRDPTRASVEYVSICAPNYLHDAHIRFALRIGAHAICEKPLVLNPWNAEALLELEAESRRRVYNVLQLRYHPVVRELRASLAGGRPNRKHDVRLTYITSRGKWYLYSWKGDAERAGGLATNIGIHFFDMLGWIFGPVERNEVHLAEPRRTAGYLELERARVRWFLSIAAEDLPAPCSRDGQRTFREIAVDGQDIEFSGGFADLHTDVYRDILAGGGYGIADAMPSIRLCHDIRSAAPARGTADTEHPLLQKS